MRRQRCLQVGESVRCAWDGWCVLSRCCVCVRSLSSVELCGVRVCCFAVLCLGCVRFALPGVWPLVPPHAHLTSHGGAATQTIGVVGTGNIGLAVIRIFKGFGTRVIAHDPYGKPELAEELGFEYVSLEELLESSDIISLHCPLVRFTRRPPYEGRRRYDEVPGPTQN